VSSWRATACRVHVHVASDMITAIDMIADPARLREFDLVVGDW
jgi:hypothetical protein